MIKVLVADDEINVVNLICNLIDWRLFDMEIVAVAHNGTEALELIEKHAPDLVITDIRMPGCDGMEMISRAKQINETLEFIIISGYRHFDYAQKAIRFGVRDYLLKPIKKDELSSCLQKTADRYRYVSQEEQQAIRRRNDIERLRTGLFTELIPNRTAEPALDSVNNDYHFQFAPGFFQFFIIKLDYPHGLYSSDTIFLLIGRITQRVHRLLQPDCHDLQLYPSGNRVYGVLNYDGGKRTAIRRQLKVAIDEMGVFENMRVTFGLGAVVERVEQLAHSLTTAEFAVTQRLIDGAALIESVEAAASAPLDYKSIEAAIEVLDAGALSEAISRLMESQRSGYGLFSTAQDICRTCMTLLRSHNVRLDELKQRHEAFVTHADLCRDAGELSRLLFDSVLEALEDVLNTLRQAEKKPVRLAKQYIQEHYASPITLEEVASHVGFTPSYFSTLFKKESGGNFLEYLSEIRMNSARELLKETNMTVAAICDAVGYSDIKHFTKSFKKHTGLRPAEYRKIFS